MPSTRPTLGVSRWPDFDYDAAAGVHVLLSLANAAPQVTGCRFTRETRVQGALDERAWWMLLATSLGAV
jgi:hypothetical protein